MSIYSGFATRQQEETYDHILDSLLYIMQKRLVKFYSNQPTDQAKFLSITMKLHNQLKNMEKSKYLEPKSSLALKEIIHFINCNYDQIVSNGVVEVEEVITQPPQKPVKLWVEKEEVAKATENSNGNIVSNGNNGNTLSNGNGGHLKPIGKELRKLREGKKESKEYGNKMNKEGKEDERSIRSIKEKRKMSYTFRRPKKNSTFHNGYEGGNSKEVMRARLPNTVIGYHGVDEDRQPGHIVHNTPSPPKKQPEPVVDIKGDAVADIIKDYIIKSKKNQRGRRSTHHSQDRDM